MYQPKRTALLAAAVLAVSTTAFADEEHGDIEIGADIANKLGVILPGEPVLLEPISGLVSGWSAAEPGLFEVEAPEEGLSPLAAFSNTGIELELVSADAGFFFFQAGTFTPLDDPGDSAALGLESGAIHSHPTWVIDSSVVGTDFLGSLDATFILTDTGGNYGDSDAFTLTFTNVPEPGSLAILGLGGLAMLRRRR